LRTCIKWRRLMAAPTFPLELELHRIDCLCSNSMLENYVLLLDRVRELANEVKLPPPLLNGRDLISLGIKPGPLIGDLLNKISELQLEGEISTREEAFKKISYFLKDE